MVTAPIRARAARTATPTAMRMPDVYPSHRRPHHSPVTVTAVCTTVVDLTGHWLSSPNDLAAFGWIVQPDDDLDYDPADYDPEQCLCGVDVEAVLDRHGVPYHLEAGGGFIVLGDAP